MRVGVDRGSYIFVLLLDVLKDLRLWRGINVRRLACGNQQVFVSGSFVLDHFQMGLGLLEEDLRLRAFLPQVID